MAATPLKEALDAYIQRAPARFHTPGHKGRLEGALAGAAPYDLTEVTGCDSLFCADGPILATEERYRALYGTAGTFLSAGGSTLCIQAMLALVQPLGRRVLLGRNVHHSAVNAMALLGLTPVWLYPDEPCGEGLPGRISPRLVAETLGETEEVAAVYLTSPDYFGVLQDIPGIAAVCKERGIPLLVDNAHGAHLPFGWENLHPIHLGADLCCDSLHKTLPVLTGGALLQVGNPRFLPGAREAMALFGSTSPSYLILLSMDENLAFLEGAARQALQKTADIADWLTRLAQKKGYAVPQGPCDPTRVVLGFWQLGYTKEAFLRLLTERGVEAEYCSDSHAVFLLSPHTADWEIDRLMTLIDESEVGEPHPCGREIPRPRAALPLRAAVLAEKETLPLADCLGRVAAQTVSFCPPGVPLLLPGEEVDTFLKNSLFSYGVTHLTVVK